MLDLLTPRQQEITGLVAAGLTNAEIARRLVITSGTVANHMEHILRRLGLRSRTQVGIWAVERGLHRLPIEGSERVQAEIRWGGRIRGVPFVTVLAPAGRHHLAHGRRHQVLPDRGRQMLQHLRRRVPDRAPVVVAEVSALDMGRSVTP